MIVMSSDRVHAAVNSHTSSTSSTPDHHDALQPSPRLHNFKLNNGKEQSEFDPARLLLDGEPQERAVQIVPPAKQRAKPPPLLTLAIPEQSLAQDEWHIVPSSPGASNSGAATHSQLDYSDVGAGYFSPAHSPDASPTTPVPPNQSPATTLVKRARLRARSVANGDLSILSLGKNRGVHKMVKERRSLQSFFSTPFLQPHSTPLGVIPGPRTEAHSIPAQSGTSGANTSSSTPSGADENRRSERGRSFYSRRRSHTYSGSGRDNALTSPSLAAFPARVPPMPEVPEEYPPLTTEATSAGRESPSSYLLDEDPFAVSSPILVAPPRNSPTQSPGRTPTVSPACSITHSRTSSSVSLSSASSTSMPSTPVFQSFSPFPEEEESEGLSITPTPAAPLQSVPVPPPPPPTPASPLNPNPPSDSALNERAKSKEQMLRPLFATPFPVLDHSHSASASPRSPSHASSSIQSLQQLMPTRVRPAHTRPAFAPRPSLPSLSTLSRMGVAAGEFASSLRGKKRRGKVGAGLPEEPWDLPSPKPASEGPATEEQENRGILNKKTDDEECSEVTPEFVVASSELMESCCTEQLCDAENSSVDLDEHPVVHTDAKPAQNSPVAVDSVDVLDISGPQDPEEVEIIDESTESPGTSRLSSESEKQEPKNNESVRERAAEREDEKMKIEVDVGNAHGEGALSTDREVPYIISFTSSENVEDTNGGNAVGSAMATACSDNAPYSETSKEREDTPSERDTDREADQLMEARKPLNVERPGDDSKGGEDFERLAASEPEPRSPVANVRPRAVTIPGHASATSKHILRSLTPYPVVAPRSASPAPSDASWSPESSVEDFGFLLSSLPAFRGDQRPESLMIDPALPNSCAHTEALEYREPFSNRNEHIEFADCASSLSLTFAPLPSPLPLLIRREGADPEIDGSTEETGTDVDLRSASDCAFASGAALPAESLTSRNYATLSDASLSFEESLSPSSPVATFSEPDSLERSLSRSPIREDEHSLAFASPEDHSLSSRHEEDYLNDHDHEQLRHELEEEQDSSMLPPLSTLPEEDPVFTLTPGHSRERSERREYESLLSRSLSRKASAATLASIFSMRSGSSGCVSHSSQLYSRTQSPAASLSATLPTSTSQSGPETGPSQGRRAHGSSFGSADSGRGHVPSASASSLRSKSSVDLRGLAKSRRNGSQSSGVSMLTHSSSRTKFESQVQAYGRKESSIEDVARGLHAYAGNAYAAAVQVELEGKVSKYEPPSSTRFGDDELVIDIKAEDKKPSDAAVSGWKPYDSKVSSIDAFEPGSSAGTLRPSTRQIETERTGSRSPSENNKRSEKMESLISSQACTHANGYEYSGGRSGGRTWGDGMGHGNGYYGQRKASSGDNYAGNYRASNMGRGGRDNSRDDDRDRSSRRPSTYSSSESESESESETDGDVYGEQSPRSAKSSKAHTLPIHALSPPIAAHEDVPIFTQLRKGRKGVFKPAAGSTPDKGTGGHTPAAEDDDVPIAQRIPGALQAQKSIRQKAKNEHERRRRERSVAPSQRTSRAPEGTISPPPQHVPSINPDERGRTLTARIPRTAPLGVGAAALSSSQEAAIIAQRMAQPHYATRAVHRPRAKTLSGADGPGVSAEDLAKRLLKVKMRDQDAQVPDQRTSAVASIHTPASATDKSPAERSLAVRTMSKHRAPSPQQAALQSQRPSADTPVPPLTLRSKRSFHGVSREPASPASIPVPSIPASSIRQHSPSRARQSHDPIVPSGGLSRSKSLKSPRRSEEEAHTLAAHYPHSMAASVPPLPTASRGPSPPAPSSRHNLIQMRIYISDMQRFNVVEIGLDTSAKDVLDMLRQQGDLRGEDRRSASWVLYEVCHDFGMERPVRSFELVADISGSWDKEKTKNCFMVKPSSFAQILTNIPSSIPTRSGFVDYESKKGKWSKRWLELREHGLWLSKREGKDDEFLCSLSVFDAYIVTRMHKATKSFSFAVKSTDPITLFENKADYFHVFSVPEDTGVAWLEAIWLARSYILYQEKNILFRSKAEGSANLARAGTRKKPAQTYINLSQPKMPGAAEGTGPFEPGSLLAKRAVS